MSARFADTTMSFVATRPASGARPAPSGLRRTVQWLLDMPRRRAVINELDALSDHELADIGLSRSDVPRVFDVSFAAQRTVA